ncbi:MAG: FAD-binding domain-containing protein [Dokdonia sp.]|jgi:deoxyribodipyrimidine photo-lyase
MSAPLHTSSVFPTQQETIWAKLETIAPKQYAATRNFLDGAVTMLSPYISRGFMSTKQIFHYLLDQGWELDGMEKIVQELAWRDYWQQIWVAKGDAINEDLKHPQKDVAHWQMPKAVAEGSTGIIAIDQAVKDFYKTGYIHNHMRMYIAALTCNTGGSHWRLPAQWMYYHLLDGDWASNALSWQWVAGSNSNKKYIANQENINKYCYTQQQGSFLDISYEALAQLETPAVLKETIDLPLTTPLPVSSDLVINPLLDSCIYTSYNLDPLWRNDKAYNRILLLEPSHFEKYPIGQKPLDFIMALSQNIPDIQVYVGEFDTLKGAYDLNQLYYKEHPTNQHFQGIQEERDWMFSVRGYFPSFFSYWKKCKKEFKKQKYGA